jgi:hypothetical protein
LVELSFDPRPPLAVLGGEGLFYGSFVCDLSLVWFVSSSIYSPQFLPSE